MKTYQTLEKCWVNGAPTQKSRMVVLDPDSEECKRLLKKEQIELVDEEPAKQEKPAKQEEPVKAEKKG